MEKQDEKQKNRIIDLKTKIGKTENEIAFYQSIFDENKNQIESINGRFGKLYQAELDIRLAQENLKKENTPKNVQLLASAERNLSDLHSTLNALYNRDKVISKRLKYLKNRLKLLKKRLEKIEKKSKSSTESFGNYD